MNPSFFPILLAFSCLLACQPDIPAAGGELEKLYHTWTLVGIETNDKWESVPASLNDLSMELNDQLEARLNSSCNQGGGEFVADAEGSISFSTSVWTEVYCGQLGDKWERLYINSLSSVTHFSLAGDQLWLWNDSLSLRFQR